MLKEFQISCSASVDITSVHLVYRPPQGYRIYNTWMGDPSKVIMLEEVVRVIQRDRLLENVNESGDVLMKVIIHTYIYTFPSLCMCVYISCKIVV